MVIVPDGARYQEDCAGEVQRQVTGMDWTGRRSYTEWQSKMWSWVFWDSEPRITVLERPSSYLPDRQTVPRIVAWKLPKRQTIKYGLEGFGTKNHWAGEGQQQFCSHSVSKRSTLNWTEEAGSFFSAESKLLLSRSGHYRFSSSSSPSLVKREWPVLVRSLLSPKSSLHFKTYKSLERNKNIVAGRRVAK
jgi:hypothetical protein